MHQVSSFITSIVESFTFICENSFRAETVHSERFAMELAFLVQKLFGFAFNLLMLEVMNPML